MKKYSLGTWAEIPSPYATHVMMTAGFDFMIIDLEHGVIDFETAQNMIFAAHALKKKAYVRVPAIEESWTLRVLDMGVDGIIFPQVQSEEQVKKIIEITCFSPVGNRGFNPYITAGGYSKTEVDYFQRENERIEIGIILEGKEVFDNIDAILAYKEINIVYIGQYDLSVAMGVPGNVNHPKVLELMDLTIRRINENNKAGGCMVHSPEEAIKVIEQGFNFVVYQVDTGLLHNTIERFVSEVNKNEVI